MKSGTVISIVLPYKVKHIWSLNLL